MRLVFDLANKSIKQIFRKKDKSLKPILGGILAIAFAVVPLVLVYHVSDGMIEGILDRYLETSSYHFKAYPLNTSIDDSETLEKMEGYDFTLRSSFWERDGFGLLASDQGNEGVQIRAIDPKWYEKDSEFRKYLEIKRGEFNLTESVSGLAPFIMGDALASRLNLSIGDEVRLITVRRFSNGRSLPRVNHFYLAGTVTTGYQELDELWTFLSYDEGSRILTGGESLRFLGIKINDPYHSDLTQVQMDLRKRLGPDWRIYNWEELNYAQKQNFDRTKATLFLIMFLMVTVAIANIGSAIVMLGLSKRLEIAILKSLGLKQGYITCSYMLIAVYMTVIGTLIGCGIGVVMSLYVNELLAGLEWLINSFYVLFSGESISLLSSEYYLETIPIIIRGKILIQIFIFSLLLSLLFSYRPARKLSKISPTEVFNKT